MVIRLRTLKHSGERWSNQGSFWGLALFICFLTLLIDNSAFAEDEDIASRLYQEGNVALKGGSYEEALRNLEESFRIFERLGDKSGMTACLNNIGYIYRMQKDYSRALSYYNRSLVIARQMDDKTFLATTLSNIGKIHEAKNNFTQALSHYEQALKILRDIGDKDLEARIMNNIRLLKEHLGKIQGR